MPEMGTHVPTPVAHGPEIISELAKAAHDLRHRLTVATERLAAAEASAERAEAAHAGCDAQVRELVSKALRAVRGQEAAESRAERLAEALREIAVGLIAEDKLHGNKFEGSLCAARLVGIARAALSRPVAKGGPNG